jgi:hypothetical protein
MLSSKINSKKLLSKTKVTCVWKKNPNDTKKSKLTFYYFLKNDTWHLFRKYLKEKPIFDKKIFQNRNIFSQTQFM